MPTRVVVGYPPWYGPLQTHYVDDVWLDGRGWVRLEPQSTSWPVTRGNLVAVSVVDPEQEGAEALSADRWSMRGVPWMTLFEPGKGELVSEGSGGAFPTCPACDHAATGVFAVDLAWLAELPRADRADRAARAG